MTYPVNPNDPTTPTNDQGATQGAEELRALKTLLAGIVVVSLSAPGVRQAIQSSSLDANGYNNAITVGAGLRPGLAATTNPLHLSAAAGFAAGKPLDTNESIVADVADILGADLSLNNTSFLYRNIGAGFGSTLVPPQYGYSFDRTKGSLLNFEAADASVIMIDDFGNTWTANGNAQIDTAQFKFGTASLLLDGAGDFIKSTNFTTMGDGSWEVSLWFRINALPGVGANATLFGTFNATIAGFQLLLQNTAGTTKLNAYISSNGTSQDIANPAAGTNTVWTLNQWNKVRITFDNLAGSYKVFLSLNAAAESTDITVASASKICGITKFIIGAGVDEISSFFNGWIDAFRFLSAATNTTTENPVAVAPIITDYKHNFFSIPQMKMFEVTAASVAAGVNPTLTAVVRLFLAEADTSGAAVTVVRNYAVRGQYQSIDTVIPGLGVRTAFVSNLGIPPDQQVVQPLLRNYTADLGYTPGMTINFTAGGNAAFASGDQLQVDNRNTLSLTTGSNSVASILNRTTGATIGITAVNWKMFIRAGRTW